MANTQRRKIKGDKMFLPMNIQGGSNAGKEYFITAPKLCILGGLIFIIGYTIAIGSDIGFKPLAWVIIAILYTLMAQWVIRKLVLEENYLYKVYDKILKLGDVTPDLFWRVSSIRKTPDGDILVFSDLKIACIVRLERDTIVGRAEDSAEIHYDSWSDFYRELHVKDLRFIQMNLMEPSGKDPRLGLLGNTAAHAPNANVRDALEMEMGFLKTISGATLSEFDYLMLWTPRTDRMDSIIADISECSYKLLGGAYSQVKILTEKEINELPKTQFNVEFFDGVQAQMNVYRDTNRKIPKVLSFKKIKFSSGEVLELNEKDSEKLSKLSSLVDNGALLFGEWTVKDALDGKIDKLNKFKEGSLTGGSIKHGVQVESDSGSKKKGGVKKGTSADSEGTKKGAKKGAGKNDVGKGRKAKKKNGGLFNRKDIDISMEDEEIDLNEMNLDDEDDLMA